MKTSLGSALASAANTAVRSLGSAGAALLAARPPAQLRPPAQRPPAAPPRDAAVIRIEVSVSR